jgi:hypothetical protein
MSIRFDDDVLDRLRRRARSVPGATPSGLVQQLVDEGLRMTEHPGILFKDGPSGRRAALALGPDVWEVVKAVREVDERDDAAIEAVAELLNLPRHRVLVAIDYYVRYREEIDRQMQTADEDSLAAEKAWQTARELIG